MQSSCGQPIRNILAQLQMVEYGIPPSRATEQWTNRMNEMGRICRRHLFLDHVCLCVCVSLVVAVFSTSIRYLLMFSVLFPMCGLWLSSVKSCLSSCHLKRDIQHVLKRLVVGQNSRKRSTKEQTGSFADCPKPQWWVVCSGVSSSAEEHRRVQALAERKDHESGPHPHRAEKEAGQH